MNKIKKFFNSKKKSIFSLMLAFALALSFNYSPISLLADMFKSNAYKSSSTQTYYSNSSTTTEKNIGTATYPLSLKDYFKDSSNNFNIQTYYNTRFSDLLAGHAHKYLLARTTPEDADHVTYGTHYSQFLESVGFKDGSLVDYYNKNKTTIKNNSQGTTFQEYLEYFVSHEINYQYKTESKTIPALHVNGENDADHMFKSSFYNTLANNMYDDGNTPGIQDIEVKDENGDVIGTFKDGVSDSEKFYTQSKAYERVKSYIDTEIEKTVAIYTYDGETQNKNVAAVIANNAPLEKSYYYKDNDYVSKTVFSRKFNTSTEDNTRNNVYYLDAESTTIKNLADAANNPDGSVGITTMVYDNNGTHKNDLKNNPLRYKLIEKGEYGYIDGVLTYYKYDSIPFEQYDDGTYKLFVVDDDVTPDEKATYAFLYLNVLTTAEYTAELADTSISNRNTNESGYVRVPLPSTEDKDFINNIYFTELLGITPSSDEEEDRFENLAELLSKDGKSNIYLKYKTSANRIIYIDDGSLGDFTVDHEKTYTYFSQVETVDVDDISFNEEDYYKITNSEFSSYYVNDYTLYFKKIKLNYESLTSVDYESSAYETKSTPDIPFERTTIATTDYVPVSDVDSNKKIYAFIPDGTASHPDFPSLTQTQLDSSVHNEYVKVPNSVADSLNSVAGLPTTYTYYYQHKTKIVDKIYIVVNDEVYATEKDNDVYKNLNYTVIKSSDYSYTNYISIQKTDANYNANFKLYYKYVSEESLDKNIYIKNSITVEYERNAKGEIILDDSGNPKVKYDGDGNKVYKNALFVIDDSVTKTDKETYKNKDRNFIVISTKEYEANYKFYSQVTEDDDNYSIKYTLYYKYNAAPGTEKIIYSTDKNSEVYTYIDTTADDYLASDYELITKGDDNYVEGKNLYYKRIRIAGSETYTPYTNVTTYYYSASSTVSLAANSYYAISFYVYTNGTYNSETVGVDSVPMEASFYLDDTKGYITNAHIKNISTEGTWQKHYLFVATNALLSSTVKIQMYMGDKDSILGTAKTTHSTATGSVLFDDIKITKINLTDYNKLSIDNVKVQSEAKKDADDEDILDGSGNKIYVDDYDNVIKVTQTTTRINDEITVWEGNGLSPNTFDTLFNFDSDEASTFFSNLSFENASEIDGFTTPDDLWQMYISRDVSGQGNNYLLKQYQTAYKNGKLEVSIVDEESFFKDKAPEEEEEEPEIDTDAPTEKDEDVPYIESTFVDNNKVLKLTNTSRQLTLGLISNYFQINQGEYYKLTIWIYSPDEEANATLSVNSILKTASTLSNGSMLKSTATVAANMSEHKETQTNEYGWIPVSFYIEGNALHNQNCYLTLCAAENSTVYFDNISIEKITSSAYDTANSDSDKTTYCLTLTPSTSVLSAGVTNGYFNSTTVSTNYNGEINYIEPRTPESWTTYKTSTGVIAGVVPTSDVYVSHAKTFYTEYNNSVVPSDVLKNNIYAIYAPDTINHPLNESDSTDYDHVNVYSIYSSAISLSASTVYKLSFDFMKGYNFEGTLFANLYAGSVKDENIISTIEIDHANIDDDAWNEYIFYIGTDSQTSVYLELGVKHATGTSFIRNVASTKLTDSLDKIRDGLLADADVDENKANTEDLSNKDCFDGIKFVDLKTFEFSLHSTDKVENTNTYSTYEYTNALAATSNFTTGNTGVAVATYYSSSDTSSYTVTIDKVEYYIKSFTDSSTGAVSYKMFSDSNYTDEVKTLNGKPVTVDEFSKVIVGSEKPTEYDIVETKTTNYKYTFEDDITLNNVFIDAEELNNDYSDKVLILANSYETDYTLATPKYSTTLSKTSYYVVKITVKTSSFEDGFGLNIDLDNSISRKWTNLDTTDEKYNNLRDENGFVCYQILISTNANSISSFNIKFSLGTDKNTGSGYAIIANVELKNFATEKLFNEYSLNYDSIDKDSNDTVIKSFFGSAGTTSNTEGTSKEEEKEEDTTSSTWATFFYIFSSLLLGIVLIIALVAVVIKKHPIKVVKQEQNDHDRSNSLDAETPKQKVSRKKKSSNKDEETDSSTSENDTKKDDGFI